MSELGNRMEQRNNTNQEGNQAEQQPVLDVVELAGEGSGAPEGGVTTDAWTMAALAHASIILTLLMAFAGGVGALVGLAVPLVIYLSHRERSRFIALHALQALVYQGVGILLYLILVVVLALTVTVAWTISGLLSAVAIGLLLMPLALLITLLMVVVLLGAPLAWVAYGLYATYQVYQGNDFRYWLLGEWVDREVMV